MRDAFIERQEEELRRRLDAQIAAEGGPSADEVSRLWSGWREQQSQKKADKKMVEDAAMGTKTNITRKS